MPAQTLDFYCQQSDETMRRTYSQLKAPTLPGALGRYRAVFTGSTLRRAIGAQVIGLLGFRGWWGKDLCADGWVQNLFMVQGTLTRKFPTRMDPAVSKLDGGPALALTYPRTMRWPWPWVTDELRALDDDHLLGMSLFSQFPLTARPTPFILQRVR
jgi:hypothetical protein